jgi:hypothetical protein
MVFSKREQILIDRFKKSGRVVNEQRLNAPFRLTVRPLTTVGTAWGYPFSAFDDEAFSLVKESKFDSAIKGIMVTPIIMDEAIAKAPVDSLRYKANEKTIYVAIGIDHSVWSQAENTSRIDLLADNIRSSIHKVPDKRLTGSDRANLLAIVDQVQNRLKSRLVH